MNPVKNVQFTRLIKAGGQLREFNFRKSDGVSSPMVTVDVADMRGERHYIRFTSTGDQWHASHEQLPEWIQEVLPSLQDAAKEA